MLNILHTFSTHSYSAPQKIAALLGCATLALALQACPLATPQAVASETAPAGLSIASTSADTTIGEALGALESASAGTKNTASTTKSSATSNNTSSAKNSATSANTANSTTSTKTATTSSAKTTSATTTTASKASSTASSTTTQTTKSATSTTTSTAAKSTSTTAKSTSTTAKSTASTTAKSTKLTYTTITTGEYLLTSEYGTVLDVASNNAQDHTNVVAKTASGNGTQRFQIKKAGTDSKGTYYTIIAKDSQLAVSPYGGKTADKTNIDVSKSNSTTAQYWYVAKTTTAKGATSYVFVNKKSSKALTVASSKSGANVYLYTSLGSRPSQNWVLTRYARPDYTTIEEGAYVISSENGKVLDVAGGETENLTNVQVYGSSQVGAQRFHISAAGTDKYGDTYYTIANVLSGKVLDLYAQGKADGSNIEIYESNNTAAQRWYVLSSKTAKGKACYVFVNAVSGKALNVAGSTNGSNVNIWCRNGKSSQNWIATKCTQQIADGAYQIRSYDTSYVIGVKNSSGNDSANVQLASRSNATSRMFAINYDSYSGYYTVTNYGSGKVLDVTAGSKESGANVQQYVANGTPAQLWHISKNSNGSYTFMSALVRNALSLNNNAATGVNVQTETKDTSLRRQQFTLKSVTPTFTGTNVRLQNEGNTNLVLNVKNSSTLAGTALQLSSKNGTFSQTYVMEKQKDNTYTIRPVVSGQYVSSKGSAVTQQAKSSAYTQRWVVEPTNDGHFTIRAANGTATLGVKLAKSGYSLYAAKNAKNDGWNFVAASLLSSGTYTISLAADPSLSVAVDEGICYNGDNVYARYTSDATNQKFVFQSLGNDNYTILGAWSALAWDVYAGDAYSGANVQQYESNKTDAQIWHVTWNDGAFTFKSALGDYALSFAGTYEGANAQLAKYNTASKMQRFLVSQTTRERASYPELIEVLDTFATGNDLVTFKTPNKISNWAQDALWDALGDFWDLGLSAGFTLIDCVTGAGITYNSDTVYYSACSIKGPYSMALADYQPDALWEWQGSYWHALDYSNNETYQAYFYEYGTWPLEWYNEAGHVERFNWCGWTATYTAEDLARMWVVSTDFLLGDTKEAAWLREVLSNNSSIISRWAATDNDAGPVYAKSGWTNTARTEGSLTIDGDHPYVLSIMSTADLDHSYLCANLASVLFSIHRELIY